MSAEPNYNQRIGKLIKDLRKERCFSVDNVSLNIVSASFMRKLEAGQTGVSVITLLQILKKLKVDQTDFFKCAVPELSYDDIAIIKVALEPYYNRDVLTLRKQLAQQRTLYLQTTDQFYLINQAIIASLIKSIDPAYITDPTLSSFICDYLTRINNWGSYEIFIFSNCTAILPSQVILHVSKLFIVMETKFEANHRNTTTLFIALINAVETLLGRQQIQAARFVLRHLLHAKIPVDAMIVKFKMTFFDNLIEYDAISARHKNTSLIDFLREIGYSSFASFFQKFMDSFLAG